MKKLDNIDQLDALFKSKLDKAQVPAPPDVWANVASASGIGSSSVISQLGTYFSSVTNIVKVALFAGGIGTVGLLMYQANTSKPQGAEKQARQEVLLEQGQTADEQTVDDAIQEVPDQRTESNGGAELSNEGRISQSSTASGAENNGIVAYDEQVAQQGAVTTDQTETQTPNSENIDVKLTINSLSQVACPGETRTFVVNDHEAGDWFINDHLVKRGSDVMSHRFTESGKYVVSFQRGALSANYTLDVAAVHAAIVSRNLNNGQYELKVEAGEYKVKQWMMNNSILSSDQVIYPIVRPGKTMFTAELSNGTCTVIAQKLVEVSAFKDPEITTAFSPNNDGKNDTYFIDIEGQKVFYLQILDRQNKVVFETTDPNVAWNGKVQNLGGDCPAGLYTMILKYQFEGQEQKLVREKLLLKR